MSWNSVVEFHETIRGDVDTESLRIGAEESCKVINGWEKEEVKPTRVERRTTGSKEKNIPSFRKAEKGMKSVGARAVEGVEETSKSVARQIKDRKLAAMTAKKNERIFEARLGELGSFLKDIGLGGDTTKENTSKASHEGLEFGSGSRNNPRGAFN